MGRVLNNLPPGFGLEGHELDINGIIPHITGAKMAAKMKSKISAIALFSFPFPEQGFINYLDKNCVN
jgi:hypothetical protein